MLAENIQALRKRAKLSQEQSDRVEVGARRECSGCSGM